jgi:hypothetical protein
VNQLDPQLRSLLRSSRPQLPFLNPTPPSGFTDRVLANAWHPNPSGFPVNSVSSLISAVAWISCAVILCGSLFLLQHAPDRGPETHFSSTARFLVRDLIP